MSISGLLFYGAIVVIGLVILFATLMAYAVLTEEEDDDDYEEWR
jgi:hypothetical protein